MVEEELQQAEVISPQVATQEKVASEPAVEILDQRTGSNCRLAQLADCLADLPEPTAQFLTQSRFLSPTPTIAVGAAEHLEHAAE